MLMPSPCAGDALDPPLWKVPNKALSLPLSLSLSQRVSLSLSRPERPEAVLRDRTLYLRMYLPPHLTCMYPPPHATGRYTYRLSVTC
jgi:hypothetical protein